MAWRQIRTVAFPVGFVKTGLFFGGSRSTFPDLDFFAF